jgi:hypothetical protein
MKWLLKNNYINNGYILRLAVSYGNLDNIKWVYKNTTYLDGFDIFGEAIRNGNLENMKWLYNTGKFTLTTEILEQAIIKGNLNNIKWLRSKGCKLNDYYMFPAAARNGNLDNMKWLLENGCSLKCNTLTLRYAISNGKQKNIKWLLENGCPGDYSILLLLIKSSNLENIKIFCLNNPEIIDERSVYALFNVAIRRGNLETMKWLYENGCKYDLTGVDLTKHTKNIIWLRKIANKKYYTLEHLKCTQYEHRFFLIFFK